MRSIEAVVAVLLGFLLPVAASAAELEAKSVDAYERYISDLERSFREQTESDGFLTEAASLQRTRLLDGTILAGAGYQDGIIDVPGGLIHHWRATAFVPGVTLRRILMVTQDFPRQHAIYDWVTRSGLLSRESDRFRVFLRLRRRVGIVSGVLDLWVVVDYRYPRPDRAVAVSDADCVREVKDADQAHERRLPLGTGSGYLWRANTLTKYLERDGGVYVEINTVGLSRRFPPMLGWIIEPIARRLGRSSAEDSLAQLRRALTEPESASTGTAAEVEIPGTWCGA